jgi:tripartite-type tricarboxylate transporter receptor subunit TctC
MMTRISLFVFLSVCSLLPATAQEWPVRPLTLVVPFGAGGGADIVGRVLAARLGDVLGQSVVVENVAGAGGMVGSSRVARAAPDGYQILLGTVGTHAQNQTLYKKPLYDSRTDFEPVALFAELPIVLVTTSQMPVSDLPSFISFVKANHAKLQYASPGAGSSNHLACLLLNAAIGVEVTHVPYRGAAELFQDLIAGRVDYFCPTSTAALTLVGGTKPQVNAITVLGPQRIPVMPSVPSAQEQGLANFDTGTWFAIFAPKGTPAAIVKKLNDAMVVAATTPSVQTKLRDIGASVVTPDRMSPAFLQKMVIDEVDKWAGPIRQTGMSID